MRLAGIENYLNDIDWNSCLSVEDWKPYCFLVRWLIVGDFFVNWELTDAKQDHIGCIRYVWENDTKRLTCPLDKEVTSFQFALAAYPVTNTALVLFLCRDVTSLRERNINFHISILSLSHSILTQTLTLLEISANTSHTLSLYLASSIAQTLTP